MARTKVSEDQKNDYITTIILAAILLGGVFAFWFGLRIGFRTENPLLAVASGSMVPTLNVGDLIVVQGVSDPGEIVTAPRPEGDIIVFHKSTDPGELIVHRAVEKIFRDGEWYFTTMGDYNAERGQGSASWETEFPASLIVGKVVGVVPWIGNVPLFVRTTQGLITIVSLFVVIILIEYIPTILKKFRTEEQSVPEDRENPTIQARFLSEKIAR